MDSYSSIRRFSCMLLPFVMWLTVSVALAQSEVNLRGGFSGNWAAPDFESQGVQVEIVDKRTAVVAWFTYGLEGQPLWLFGTGDIEGSLIRADMLALTNGVFPALNPESQQVVQESWGGVVIDFSDCDSAQMSWESSIEDYPDGSIDLGRVTAIEGLDCGAAEVFEKQVQFSLDAGPGMWKALYFDYPVGREDQLEEVFEWTALPEPLSHRHGLEVGGTNRSDNLAMYITTMIGGLAPLTEYEVVQDLTFATNVPSNCAGVGGSPGESVYMHLGASATAPEVIEIEEGTYYDLNVGRAKTLFDGQDALSVGNMANTQDCEAAGFPGEWELKTVSTAGSGFVARTDNQGRLWLFGGSDSAFEDRSTFYVTDWVVKLRSTGAESP